jgi:hypothetical protein
MRTWNRPALGALLVLLAACAKPPPPQVNLLAPNAAQMQLRSLQTRSIEAADRDEAIRGVIATLQDLGFIIERANASLGLVTAARFAEPNFRDVMAVTVTVRPESNGKMLVRLNAIYNNKPVEEPTVYQNFFATLERSLFVASQEH